MEEVVGLGVNKAIELGDSDLGLSGTGVGRCIYADLGVEFWDSEIVKL